MLWKHSPAARVPTAFLVLPNFHSRFNLTIRLFALDFYHVMISIEIESELSMRFSINLLVVQNFI